MFTLSYSVFVWWFMDRAVPMDHSRYGIGALAHVGTFSGAWRGVDRGRRVYLGSEAAPYGFGAGGLLLLGAWGAWSHARKLRRGWRAP